MGGLLDLAEIDLKYPAEIASSQYTTDSLLAMETAKITFKNSKVMYLH